ncbi:phytyl ester synthase 1, chloroplastic-like [Salvia hispanica]|uniref:phytyl ester synthase 1, chloroplastic-like n=1 Tax=Salvia hispanica TaxID=49212 RepID=UPI002009AD5A|nr:phytyl ester synthase 1, chloroplastic-like [Salvia hispanica]
MSLSLSCPILLHKPSHHPVSFPHPRLPNHSWKIASTKKQNPQELKPLWDDGYGTQTVRDYIDVAKAMAKPDGGPPRWFCPVESGPPLENSPLLLYLPGIDGVGMGMVVHHKAMGKVFRVRCLHIPADDRTAYEDLVEFVGAAVEEERASSANMPVYLVGDSFGGCLALSVAAAKPAVDIVLILVNPATSFERSQLQPLLPFMDVLPAKLLPYLLGATCGDPMKMAAVINATESSPSKQLERFVHELSALPVAVSNLADILPKETLQWKIKLLKSGAASSNSRLHAVNNEALILASGRDAMLPSKDEAERLSSLLKNSKVRFFKDNGHLLLMEDGINLLSVIKGNHMYRRSKKRNHVMDFLPPSKFEFHHTFDNILGMLRLGVSPVMLSTMADGEVVRGLSGVPDQGPVLLVGYHMLVGAEISTIAEEFLREKKVMIHGLAHPMIFGKDMEAACQEASAFDYFKVFGAIPVSAANLCRSLIEKRHVLLYPGGVREALHRKGEAYKLFWPEDPEFVRAAAKYGAKIVPFGVVGEDDVIELLLDYDDLIKIPIIKNKIKRENENMPRVRAGKDVKGKVGEQIFYVPGFYPKVPGRFYFLFGKPMEMEGRGELMTDKARVMEVYLQLQGEVERCMAYLIKKRDEDPYRHFLDRLLYRTVSSPIHETPTFDP